MKKVTQVKTLVYACSSIVLSLYLSSSFANTTKLGEPNADTQKMVNFLANAAAYTVAGDPITGKGYMGSVDKMWYPLSYVSDAKTGLHYWGDTVCQGQCAVHDQEISNPGIGGWHIWPDDPTSVPGGLQFERIDAITGTNVYDASLSQMVLALAATHAAQPAERTTLLSKANDVTTRIANIDKANNNKGIGPAFSYGDLSDDAWKGNPIREPKLAYGFRMVGQKFLTKDPFKGTAYDGLVTSTVTDPKNDGTVSWVDWKPITGENAWANLIGPLQTAYLEAKALGKPLNFHNAGIQNAIYSLYAFQRMQSPIGAIYYAPKGTYGNAGKDLVPDGEISTENNASTLAGLRILRNILTSLKSDALTKAEQGQVARSINLINIMIYGGAGPAGTKTEGLLNYFKNYAWNKDAGYFYQGGIYKNGQFTPNDPKHSDPNNPLPDAVDVNTWGLAVLGPQFIDQQNGQGASFRLLQSVFTWGGYKQGDKLIGVGFSSFDKGTIMSGEWTAGAINAIKVATEFYQNEGKGYITEAELTQLQQWQAQMSEGLNLLRSDNYPQADFPDKQVGYAPLPSDQLGVLYSSKRYFIPFGWYANPILSTASTAWNVFLDYGYNPFALEGSYTDYRTFDKAAPSYNTADPSGAWTPTQPINVIIKNGMPDQIVTVNLEKAPNKWETQQVLQVGGQMNLKIPVDTFALSINVGPNHWAGCTLTQDQLSLLKSGSTIIGTMKNQDSCDMGPPTVNQSVNKS